MSLRLHPKHGLNPTLSVCIICGKETGTIALLGATYKGEAPMKMVTEIEPCSNCKKKYLKEGTMLVAAEEDHKGRPKPTGDIIVITDEAFQRLFNKPPPPGKMHFVGPSLLDYLNKLDRESKPCATN